MLEWRRHPTGGRRGRTAASHTRVVPRGGAGSRRSRSGPRITRRAEVRTAQEVHAPCRPLRCASSSRPGSTSATRPGAGIPRCARSSSRSATGSTSSTSPRPSSASTSRSSSCRRRPARGDGVLFVGTKKQAQEPIAEEATRAGQPYVNQRWLGGMLTNFVTIKKRLALLEQLEARQANGDFERMSKKEASRLTDEMTRLQRTARRHAQDEAPARRRLRGRPAPRAHRRDRGPQARDPRHRDRRHERRPGRPRLHHPGQRRRHPRHPPALQPGRRRRHRGAGQRAARSGWSRIVEDEEPEFE